MESCCTCATILSATPPYPSDTHKALLEDRRVECCARVICAKCIQRNNRFAEYCPYCQVSSGPSSLPQGLRDPPSYTSVPPSTPKTLDMVGAPPPYTPTAAAAETTPKRQDINDEKAALAAREDKDTLHFLHHDHDSINSLSLRYGVPPAALRRANNITSDHLLLGRRTILIPGEYYKGGVSLSPRPVEGEDEELRKAKIRRFMTSCKVSNYNIALLYLEQCGYDTGAAAEAYFADEAWEKEHSSQGPGSAKQNAKGQKNRGILGGLVS